MWIVIQWMIIWVLTQQTSSSNFCCCCRNILRDGTCSNMIGQNNILRSTFIDIIQSRNIDFCSQTFPQNDHFGIFQYLLKRGTLLCAKISMFLMMGFCSLSSSSTNNTSSVAGRILVCQWSFWVVLSSFPTIDLGVLSSNRIIPSIDCCWDARICCCGGGGMSTTNRTWC